jgi:hypothetical protein
MSSRKRTLRTARAIGVLLSSMSFAAGVVACGGSEGGELEITNIDPRAGATAGEQAVKISGNNFRRDISYTVYFGNKRAARATILDDHTLLVASPGADEPGAVDVIVAADTGPAYRIVEGFRYEEMGGNVMENVGTATSGQGEERF